MIYILEKNMTNTIRSTTRVKGFNDAEMDFQLLRQLGSANYGGASIGEVLSCAALMENENADEWVDKFLKFANKQELDAINRYQRQHYISSKEQFLKASNTYRSVEYFIHSHKPEHKLYGLKSRDCFLNYLKLTSYHFEFNFITYNKQQLPYYIVSPNHEVSQRKTILIISGFDGTIEESFIHYGIAAIERGYNVICFAGPGQMDSVRFNTQTFFEPNFEAPITVLLDEIERSYKWMGLDKLALMGISFGGYFASRTACYEPRIKALIANSPIVDLCSYILGFADNDGSDFQDFCYDDIQHIPDEIMPPSLKEQTANLLLRFGHHLMSETITYLQQFNISENLHLIKCPTLSLIGDGEGGEPLRQFNYFINHVKHQHSYKFTSNDGADTHCQVINLGFANCVVYDWLDEVFV